MNVCYNNVVRCEFKVGDTQFRVRTAGGRRGTTAVIETDGFSASLTQLKILQLKASGLDEGEIGPKLGCSPATVKQNIEKLYKRNAVDGRNADVSRLAVKAERSELLFPLTILGLEAVARDGKL